MYQFFVEPHQVGTESISILGDDVNHIKNVLRMKVGTRIRVSVKRNTERIEDFSKQNSEQNKGNYKNVPLQTMKLDNSAFEDLKAEKEFAIEKKSNSFFGIIEQIFDEEVLVKIESQDEDGTELSNRIYLFQGLPKGDKMELIIQKAVELGVYQIIPVAMKNCVVKLDDKKAVSKVKRWQAISESAAKQSKRTIIPEIKMPLSWKLALKEAEKLDMVLIPYENERGMQATREVIQSIKPGQSIGIFVGPEGGFSSEEIESIAPIQMLNEIPSVNKTESMEPEKEIKNAIYHRISLGRRILRTETAGLATLSMLVFCLDE